MEAIVLACHGNPDRSIERTLRNAADCLLLMKREPPKLGKAHPRGLRGGLTFRHPYIQFCKFKSRLLALRRRTPQRRQLWRLGR